MSFDLFIILRDLFDLFFSSFLFLALTRVARSSAKPITSTHSVNYFFRTLSYRTFRRVDTRTNPYGTPAISTRSQRYFGSLCLIFIRCFEGIFNTHHNKHQPLAHVFYHFVSCRFYRYIFFLESILTSYISSYFFIRRSNSLCIMLTHSAVH